MLVKAVKSALAQTYPVKEVLVCDDGSTDDSKEKVLSIGDARVKWIDCGKNGRPAIPRNCGIKESSGNYIAFLDNDDEWLEDKLQKQVELLALSGLDIVCCNANKISDGKNTGPYSQLKNPQVFNFYNLVASNFVICSSVLAKKDILVRFGMFPEAVSLKALEDYFLWLKVSTAHPIYYTPELLVNYNDESSTSIRKDSLSTQQQLSLIFSEFRKWQRSTGELCPSYLTNVMKEVFVLRFMTPRERFFAVLFDR